MTFLGLPFAEPLMNWYDSLEEPWKTIVGMVVMLATIAGLLFKSLRFVHQGNIGIRKRFGRPILHYDPTLSREERRRQKAADRKALATGPVAVYGRPRYVLPGWNLMIPFVHGIEIVNVKHPTIKLDDVVVMARSMLRGSIYRSVQMTLEITDPYWWHYRFDNPGDYLKGCVNSVLWHLLWQVGYERLATLDVSQVEADLLKKCADQFTKAGASLLCDSLTLASPMPVPETVLAASIKRQTGSEDMTSTVDPSLLAATTYITTTTQPAALDVVLDQS